MGLRAVWSHQNGKKHRLKGTSVQTSLTMETFCSSLKVPATAVSEIENSPSKTANILVPEKNDVSTAEVLTANITNKNKSILNQFVCKENIYRAEILWCLESIGTHKSLRSAEKDTKIFSKMFPDSYIAQNVQLGRDKMAYIIVFGISLLLKQNLLDEVSSVEHYVIGFDESINKISQKQQMDLNIRFWDKTQNVVKTCYLTSVFLGRSRAIDLLKAFIEGTKHLNLNKLVQISMDGPNVNLRFFKELQSFLKQDPDDAEMLNIGSCGLHALNNAFKKGVTATEWKIKEFLWAIYNLFKDSPARRASYMAYSNSDLFPRKFCSVRWLENSDVAQRALEIIPNLKKYIDKAEKDKIAPANKSYGIIKQIVTDPLLPCKLTFFRMISCEIESFLREYQSDIPLVPFLYSDLLNLMKSLMERFVVKDILTKNNIMGIDLNNPKHLLTAKQTDIGLATHSSIRKIQASEKDITLFKNECRQFLLTCVMKLKERSPLTYSLTKALSCFDPTIALNESIFLKRLKTLLLILTEKKWISGLEAERTLKQLKDICCRSQVIESFKNYKRYRNDKERIDVFWYSILSSEEHCKESLKVLKIVMVFSHGNANVERGFSINNDCLWDNMKEESLIARRRVYDYIMAKGGVSNIEISKQMIQYAKSARSRFSEATEIKRKEEKEKEEMLKRKRFAAGQLKELAAKKAKILLDAQKESSLIEEEMSVLRTLKK